MIQLLWLLLIPILFFIYNYSKFLRMNNFRNLYIEHWVRLSRNENDISNLPNKKAEIVELIKGANIKPRNFLVTENVGYGGISRFNASSFDNLFYISDESIPYNTQAMAEAKEVYRRRMVNSLNPFFWLMSIVFYLEQY